MICKKMFLWQELNSNDILVGVNHLIYFSDTIKGRNMRGGARINAGRKKGSKNVATGSFQEKYRSMCQSILDRPKVKEFYEAVADDRPLARESFEVKNVKTGSYIRKVRRVRLDPKLRAEILRDIRDGAGCRPMLLVEGNSDGDSEKKGAKPSFNIQIAVV